MPAFHPYTPKSAATLLTYADKGQTTTTGHYPLAPVRLAHARLVAQNRGHRFRWDTSLSYQPLAGVIQTITLILSCLVSVSDRYALAKEFELAKFEMTIMKIDDVYTLQETCVRLFAQTLAQRRVYEEMMRDLNGRHA